MGTKLIILVSMVFCHIVDDYDLQGWLASANQKSYWEQNAPEKLYKYDYVAALFMHSFSWTFMVMLVPTVYDVILFGGTWYSLLFVGNVLIHMFVDDLKANKKKINLIQDQSIHMLQVIWTWLCIVVL